MQTHLYSEDFGENISAPLKATLHTIISLAQGLDRLFDNTYDTIESALAEDASLAQLLPVAPSALRSPRFVRSFIPVA